MFIYSGKATKFCEIFPLVLTTVHTVKSKGNILQNFATFSEYMNFIFVLYLISFISSFYYVSIFQLFRSEFCHWSGPQQNSRQNSEQNSAGYLQRQRNPQNLVGNLLSSWQLQTVSGSREAQCDRPITHSCASVYRKPQHRLCIQDFDDFLKSLRQNFPQKPMDFMLNLPITENKQTSQRGS